MLGSVLLLIGVVVGQATTAVDEDLQIDVRRAVRQLDARTLDERNEAEAKLIEMGPKILDLLPPDTARTSAEVRERLGRVRQKLQQQAAEFSTQASQITLDAQNMPLLDILAEFEKQSGNKLIDHRPQFGQQATNPTLSLQFSKTPFWQALDETLQKAGLTIYPFGEEKALHLVAAVNGNAIGSQLTPHTGRVAYSGPFRIEPTVIQAQRDLRRRELGALRLNLEIIWEPRVSPISLRQRLAEVKAVDQQGNPLPVENVQAELEVPTSSNRAASNLILPFELPPRSATEIASLQGTIHAMIPGKIETFKFDNLIDAKDVEKRVAGVTVTLQQVRRNNQLWEVRMLARFDRAGQALESYQGWVFENPAYLETADGKRVDFDTMETTRQTENEVGVAYLFVLDEPPAKMKFVYKTPGVIVDTKFDYELKNIPLP